MVSSQLPSHLRMKFAVEAVGKDKKNGHPVDNILMSDLRDPNWVHRARYLVAMYNKGSFATQRALDAFYQVSSPITEDRRQKGNYSQEQSILREKIGPTWELLKEPQWSSEFKELREKKSGKVIRRTRGN